MLSDTEVRRTKAGNNPYKLSDGGNMFLWVTPAGGKIWRWAYRFGGKAKLMTLGKYPEVSLALARNRHADARRLLAGGIDPMVKRKEDRSAVRAATEHSFAKVARLWLDHWREGKSLRHVDSTRRRLESNILPVLGARAVAEIEAPEIVAMVKLIDERGARDIAKRTLETTGQIFRYAVAHGHGRRNPAAEIRPRDILRSAQRKNYARVDARELPKLLRQIEVYRGRQVTRLALKVMAYTFVRTGELIGARWIEFDFQAARWNIPPERMKMRTPHIVSLAAQALQVLVLLKELTGESELLFPGDRDPRKPMSNNTILKALERMDYKGKMTGHGFRGLASTILHEQGYAHEYIELQLAHTPRNAVSAAYNHALHLKSRAKMMQDWADFLERVQIESPHRVERP
jgi:integrase